LGQKTKTDYCLSKLTQVASVRDVGREHVYNHGHVRNLETRSQN